MIDKLLEIINECGGTWTMRNKQGLAPSIYRIIVSVEYFFDGVLPPYFNFATNTGYGVLRTI